MLNDSDVFWTIFGEAFINDCGLKLLYSLYETEGRFFTLFCFIPGRSELLMDVFNEVMLLTAEGLVITFL